MIHRIDDLVDRALSIVRRARLDSPGQYRRFANQAGRLNEYGIADAANLLYTLGHFPQDAATRGGFVESLRAMQHADGLWRESTHHDYHCTADCLAALELFDASPLYSLTALLEFASPAGMVSLLEKLDWVKWPWPHSHRGAGVFASLFLTHQLDEVARDAYSVG